MIIFIVGIIVIAFAFLLLLIILALTDKSVYPFKRIGKKEMDKYYGSEHSQIKRK